MHYLSRYYSEKLNSFPQGTNITKLNALLIGRLEQVLCFNSAATPTKLSLRNSISLALKIIDFPLKIPKAPFLHVAERIQLAYRNWGDSLNK